MTLSQVLISLILVAAAWHVTATVLIYDELRRRGLQPSFLWLRLYGPKYAHDYRRITRAESGRTGRLFHHWVASINVALVMSVCALVAGAVAT